MIKFIHVKYIDDKGECICMELDLMYNELKKMIQSSNIKLNEEMKKYTSFKVGGIADLIVICKNIEDIKNVLKFVKENDVMLTVIGNRNKYISKR